MGQIAPLHHPRKTIGAVGVVVQTLGTQVIAENRTDRTTVFWSHGGTSTGQIMGC